MNTITLNKINKFRPVSLSKGKSLVNRALFGVSIVDLILVAGIYFAIATPQAKASFITTPPAQSVITGPSINTFIKQLPAGFVVTPLEIKKEGLSVTGRMVVVNGDNFNVFEYTNSSLAQKEAFEMSQKYDATSNSAEWKENMHLYLKDNLLIFYMGKNDSIISALNHGISNRVTGGGNVSIGYLSVVAKSGDYYK